MKLLGRWLLSVAFGVMTWSSAFAGEGSDWIWIPEPRTSLVDLIEDGGHIAAAFQRTAESGRTDVYIVQSGSVVFRCMETTEGSGSCARAARLDEPDHSPTPPTVTPKEGRVLAPAARGVPGEGLWRDPDKKRKRWDKLFVTKHAAAETVPPSEEIDIEFQVTEPTVLFVKVDAYSPKPTALLLHLDQQEREQPVFSDKVSIDGGIGGSSSRQVDITREMIEAGTAWTLNLSHDSDVSVATEVWIFVLSPLMPVKAGED